MTHALPPEYFNREDDSDDSLFYAMPRKVVHIDEPAIAALGNLFDELLPGDGVFLDLMSSWRTHLPARLAANRVVGLGLNAEEMADNPQLNDYVIHNLNHSPELPFPDASFDAAFCTVSIQYLTQPIEVFKEVYRVLKTTGVFVVSFSNRCFSAKAVAIWQATSDEQHASLVSHYFDESGPWTEVEVRHKPAAAGPFHITDPLYAVWAYKKSTP